MVRLPRGSSNYIMAYVRLGQSMATSNPVAGDTDYLGLFAGWLLLHIENDFCFTVCGVQFLTVLVIKSPMYCIVL